MMRLLSLAMVLLLSLFSTSGTALVGRFAASPADQADPIMRFAQTHIFACRVRDSEFSTAKFSADNRSPETRYATAWVKHGFARSWAAGRIGGQRMPSGEAPKLYELGEWSTTGSPDDALFRVRVQALEGYTRTSVLTWNELPRC